MGEGGELKRRIYMSDGVERRNLIQAGGLVAGAAVAAMFVDQSALAQNTVSKGTPVTYQPKPLSLDPKSIDVFMEAIRWDNAVKLYDRYSQEA